MYAVELVIVTPSTTAVSGRGGLVRLANIVLPSYAQKSLEAVSISQ
jgi:hypothetical protein